MPRIKKKGEAGAAKNYITRNQAVRKLQLSLPDFRKLCIWKGIYPREPRSRKKVSKSATYSTTFYYTKDIQYLLHEPLLKRFREQKSLEKKITKALGRGEFSDAKRLESNASNPEKTGKPRYTLNHVVRERYPTFVDAIRDMDDCLSMLFLFANLPSTSTVPAKMIARCERLCLEFQHYLIMSNNLRKSFLSIKGIYYQANIQGEDILWVVPYKFNQRIVGDVDFRIMGTFIEFYMTLLGFINFRLYTSIGLKYPPKFDQSKDDQGAELAAFTLEGEQKPVVEDMTALANGNGSADQGPDPETQEEVNKIIKTLAAGDLNGDSANGTELVHRVESAEGEDSGAPTEAFDRFAPAQEGGDVLPQPSYSTNDPSQLFAKCTFYLSRETPRQSLEFILRAFGCRRIGWDEVLGEGAFTTNELDPSITHQVVDRPPIVRAALDEDDETEDNQTAQKLWPNSRVPGRVYVQPQWVWDSINDEELKEPHLYAPGAQLPPHLSPFVKPREGQYDPRLPLEEQQTEAEALNAADEEEEGFEDEDEDEVEEEEEVEGKNGAADVVIDETANGMDVAGSSDDESDQSEDDGSFAGFSDGEGDGPDEEASAALQRQRELEAEMHGKPVQAATEVDKKSKARADAKAQLTKRAKEEAEELERAKGMLSKKKRRLYEQMVYTNSKRSAEDETLRAKRRKIEKQKTRKAKA